MWVTLCGGMSTALKAIRIAGEELENNSPLFVFPQLKCTVTASNSIPPLNEWEDLREELKKLNQADQVVGKFDVRKICFRVEPKGLYFACAIFSRSSSVRYFLCIVPWSIAR